ncbi:membrane protein insertase YidC [Brumimicrobium glaciale]|jgi:YidC/Oxa1 family membrane protein insertase|uniref:Membrane protein insertase YidC n=1 Tax=Brumimicrobium glaciale TaxID=200475 RepID=A0A4V1WFW5_9FLAO|nr:membrane protein insertase YidC [Brumimicrobium glaciale]RYM34616.1 membrane protein insertase YidC [Brumimicrobium glaciale]
MDKNTIIGLGLIGVILALFTFFNQPSEEELKERMAQQEQIAQSQKDAVEKADKKEKVEKKAVEKTEPIAKLDLKGEPVLDSLGNVVYTTEVTPVKKEGIVKARDVEEETYFLENEKLKVVLTNKGGGVKSVYLKDHQTYDDFRKNEGTDKIEPLQLFNEEVASNGLVFNTDDGEQNTSGIAFEISKNTDSYISFIANFKGGKSIEQIYSITPDQYHINYEVKMNGFEGEVNPEKVFLDWHVELLKTERLLTEQRRISTVFFKEKNGSYDYLSEHSDDEFNAETDVDWVAFKQSYFSSIMMPEKGFKKEGTSFKVTNYAEGSEKDSSHIKVYNSSLNLAISNTGNGSAEMKWFFGPNDYDLLESYANGTEDIINYGWGLFRWINIYAIQPLFVWLAAFGMNLGIAILLLTVGIKLILTPIQWKMYASSAKMRILKPEVEEINKKFPEKDDAMKKQMEMMSLYRESGASPLAGCVPMLIQMPILFAVFRFFPSTFTLRQESFLWAEDLSSYDSVLDLSFNIPFYGAHVSLFTLLMAVTTLFYTVLNSSNMQQPSQPGMPNMKVIMYFFPFMMIFFFNNYASGLSYYYFISTLMSILTMVMIKNFFVNEDKLKAKMAARQVASKKDGGKKKGKSKFQERLEQMQKAQQEKLKNGKK